MGLKVGYQERTGKKDRNLMIVALGMGIMGTLAIVFGAFLVLSGMETQSWPTTDGVVLHTEIVVNHGGKSTTYAPLVLYQYSVDGAIYSCDNMIGTTTSSSYEWATGCLASYPEGSQVTVHYNPNNPSDAVLSAGASIMDAVPIFIGTVFLLAAILLFWKFGRR